MHDVQLSHFHIVEHTNLHNRLSINVIRVPKSCSDLHLHLKGPAELLRTPSSEDQRRRYSHNFHKTCARGASRQRNSLSMLPLHSSCVAAISVDIQANIRDDYICYNCMTRLSIPEEVERGGRRIALYRSDSSQRISGSCLSRTMGEKASFCLIRPWSVDTCAK
jgi:hypothetical protein